MQTTAVPAPKPMSRFNRFMVVWLGSPLGVLSGKARLLRYVGRVSGLPRRLPVNVTPFEGGYLVRVGRFQNKTWWRNFTNPWPMELVRGPRVVKGTAVVVPGTTDRGRRIAEQYFATHRGAARRAGLPKLPRGESPTAEQLQAAAATVVWLVVSPQR